MTDSAYLQPQPGLGIDACVQAVQRSWARAERAREHLAAAEGAVAAWRMLLGDALAEGTQWATGDIVTHPSTGPKPFVVWHFSANLPNGLPPKLILVCWPVRATDWADKVHGDEHHFPAEECTKLGNRELGDDA